MAPGFSVDRQKFKYGKWNDVYWSLYNLLHMHWLGYNIHEKHTNSLNTKPYFCIDNDPYNAFINFDVDTGKRNISDKTFENAMDFCVFNVLDPLLKGKWSPAMEKLFKNNTETSWRGKFPPVDISYMKGSHSNFIPFHYYFTTYAAEPKYSSLTDFIKKQQGKNLSKKEILKQAAGNIYFLDGNFGRPWPPITKDIPSPFSNSNTPSSLSWQGWYADGAYHLANHYYERYPNCQLMITECGISPNTETRLTLNESLNDDLRINWYSSLLSKLLDPDKCKAAKDNKFRGALLWSFSDNLEWANGYASVFGFNYINFWGPGKFLVRSPKISAGWLKLVTKNKYIIDDSSHVLNLLKSKLVINPKLYKLDEKTEDISLLDVPLRNIVLLSKPAQLGYSDKDTDVNGYATNKIYLSGQQRQDVDNAKTQAVYNDNDVLLPVMIK